METQETKKKAIELLRERCDDAHLERLGAIDTRLAEYYVDLCEHSGTELGDENDWHNVYELLGALKFLRLFDSYGFNMYKVREVIYDGEGLWRQTENGYWMHVSGGLKQPGRQGPEVYRWEPAQVFMLAAMYGPQCWIDTGNLEGERQLLHTERVRGGKIYDLRRLCTNFIAFLPRKTNKTGFSAITNCEDFMRGDNDAQIFCAANSQSQSKILYERTVELIKQLDPQGRRIRFTATETNWKPGQFRSAHLYALSAGGKTKDGLFASRLSPDEYGSAGYVNGKSDMGALVKVIESSMGPRREPMTVITTTAGNITQGPFIDILGATQMALAKEIDYATGADTPTLENDRRMCLLLMPDAWELDEDYLLTSKAVRRKVNFMLGKIVQHSFYDQECAAARMDPLSKQETIAKLFNVYTSATTKEWLKPEEIRAIQKDMRVDDCTDERGWVVFTGMDFSKGSDLNGCAYLCFNTQTGEFFGDMDVYMSEKTVNDNPIRELLTKWADDGWLHIVPGETFDPSWPVNRIIELDGKGVNFGAFGYDPYNAKVVVNAMSQWLFDIGLDPKNLIVPVRQNYATYNPAVGEFDYMVKRSRLDPSGKSIPEPLIRLSMNPLWPYCFGCCVLEESYENVKPVKRDHSAACRVDPVQMLLSGLILYDYADGKINK